MRVRGIAMLVAAIGAGGLLVAGCGGGSNDGDASDPGSGAFERQLAAAERVSASDFPAVGGRTLQELADTAQAGPQLGLATTEYTVGENRIAFGLIDEQQRFIYGKTAIYVARSPGSQAQGPFPAPADSLITEPPFHSHSAAEEDSAIAAIFSTEVPLERPGRYAVLAYTEVAGERLGAPAEIVVRRRGDMPEVGDRAPRVETDTLASAGGDIGRIDTRVPPSDMHERSFSEVIGEKPVVLLFATPALCQTRVCGPVTDMALQLRQEYGDRVEFIHQEVYEDNEVERGLREPLRAFRLKSEPWLFTIDADGRVAARLEGSFGLGEFREAIEAALQRAPASDGT